MRYIYTKKDCPKCDSQKREWEANGIEFVERSHERLKGIDNSDQIDVDAFVALCQNNMRLPVIVDRD